MSLIKKSYVKHMEKESLTGSDKASEKISKGKAISLGCLFIFVFFLVILALISPDNQDKKEDTAPKPVQKSENVVSNIQPVFNVPELFGKNIDQIIKELGKPTIDTEPTQLQISSGITDWEKVYKKDGEELMITYLPTSRGVKDFFLSGDDKKHLLEIGGLKENDPTYKLEFVKALTDPSKITGVIITSKK